MTKRWFIIKSHKMHTGWHSMMTALEVIEMKGLYNKYIIEKTSGNPLPEGFDAIVLRIDGGQYVGACRAGAKAFAEAVKEENPILSNDIMRKLLELDVEVGEDKNVK